VCGKVIVATEQDELPRLKALYKRGLENGLNVRNLSIDQLREVEPHVFGLAAVQVPSAGIVSYKRVCGAIAEDLDDSGCEIRLGSGVMSTRTLASSIALETKSGGIEARLMVNCAGLQSDRVAQMAGVKPPARIVPFRGDYYNLSPEARRLVRGLVYPVPNPDFPFLGVHLTKMIDGEVHAGPNAVLSLKREGYSKVAFDPRDAAASLTYSGFWRLAAKNWREGARELWRAASKSAFVASVQRLLPEIRRQDLIPATPGVRAQALMPNGKMVDDFLIVEGTHSLHVCNAPSPAATAGLEIGKFVGGKVIERLGRK
jgi:L-2-hydroxyglutarate oxidase